MAIDYEHEDLFKKDSVDKQLKIAFDGGIITNTELHSQQFELNESLCSEDKLQFGCCEASSIRFKISNLFTSLEGKWLTVSQTLGGNTGEPFILGRYKVESDVPTADRRFRDVVAYDVLHEILIADVLDWYNTILPDTTSEVTLKQFRDSFFSFLGVEQQQIALPNDVMMVEKTVDTNKLSGKAVITAICELNGCFGHIGRDGKFHYVFLQEMAEGVYPRNDLYPQDNLYPADAMHMETINKSHYISAKYEDYITARIDKLQIRQEEDDIGCIYGTGSNCYVVQDNFLVYGKSTADLQIIAENLYAVISKIWYRPAHVEAKGNPCLEVGDGIRLRTRYETVCTYILQRTLSGIQALRDTYDADGDPRQRENVNTVNESINQLKGKANVLKRTVEETNSRITDVEAGLESQITQTADQITTSVSRTYETKTDASTKYTNATGYADGVAQTAENNAKTAAAADATNKANQAEANAKADTAAKLQNYSTTVQMNSAISQSASSIESTVSATYETKADATSKLNTAKSYADGAAQDAEDNANNATDGKLQNYSTTTQMNSAIQQSANAITQSVRQTYATQSSLTTAVSNLQDQIDDNIETFTGPAVPTLRNAPANSWTTTTDKDKHIGDLYVVNAQGGDYAGFYYRFEKNGSVYQWTLLKDTEITKALADAAAAQATADAVGQNLSTNYSTTTQMNSAISQSASNITSSVSATYETKADATTKLNSAKTYADTKASDAESNANTATDNKLLNYSTTTQMNSAISQSASSIESTVSATYETKNDASSSYSSLSSRITQTATDISSEVTRAGNAESDLSSRITQTEESISTEVTRATNAEGSLSSRITQNATAIESTVKNGEISSKISQEAGQISIIANRISISSTYFTLSDNGKIKATDGEFSGKITASSGTIGGFTIGTSKIYSNKSSLYDSTGGVYIGTDGISVGRNGAFTISSNATNFNLSLSSGSYIGTTTQKLYFDTTHVRIDGDAVICGATDYLYFFGTATNTGVKRQKVTKISSTTSATTSTNATKINEIIDALYNYNLLGSY